MSDLTDKTVVVTGATGFLGAVIVRQLSERGAKVRALARRPGRDLYIRDLPDVAVVRGDVTDYAQMLAVMNGADYVIHSAAALSGNIETQSTVNVHGTYNVARAASACGVRRMVHVSTISVYGYRYRTDVTEECPHDPGADPYHVTKSGAERTLTNIATSYNLDYSIVRPGMIYGPYSHTWTERMFSLAQRGVWLGDGSGSAYPVYVDDVADLCLLLLTHPAASREAFNCTPDPSPTWREFLGEYAALAGGSRWVGVPRFLLRPLMALLSFTAPANSRNKDLNDLLPFLTNHITYRMDKARDLLDWTPRTSLQDGVANCAPYLREKGLL